MRQFILVILLFTSGISAGAQPKHEIRAVWLTTNYALDWPSKPAYSQWDITKQKEELCYILDQLKAANFNMIFFQTRIRGNVIYPSKIEPWSGVINGKSYSNPGYDPLEFAIQACHERGIECHAWFVVYPLGMEKVNGKKNGSSTITNNKDLVKKYKGELYLDPGMPETRTYLLSLIKEIVSQYDIDGIHFDYIRYPDKANQFPDQDTYRKYGGRQDLDDWRRSNVNQFVYQAYDYVKSVKPWVQVSSSVIGMYQCIPGESQAHWTAYSSVFQDPADWLKKGKHDFIVPMMYYPGKFFYPHVPNWQKYACGRFVVPGLGIYRMDEKESNWTVGTITDQIAYSQSKQTQGNAYYRAQYLVENRRGIMDAIKKQFYSDPAQLPALTWLDSIAPSIPSKPDAIRSGKYLQLSWDSLPESSNEQITYSIYQSENYPVDTEDISNLVATRLYKTNYSIPVDPEKETGYYFLITASDRYHNESSGSKVVFFYMGRFEK